MKSYGAVTAVALLILLSLSACAQTAQELLQQLRDDDGNRRLEAARALTGYGPEVMDELTAMLGGADRRLDLCARLAIEYIAYYVSGPQGAHDREAVAKALADIATSNKPLEIRTFAVRQLAMCGGDESLPALGNLLMFDSDMHEIARWALIRIPGQAAVDTLKRALSQTTDAAKRVGLLNALAARPSVDMYMIAADALSDENEHVRIAALNLLANIPEPAGAELIRRAMRDGSDAEKAEATKALIKLGYTLQDAGSRSAAHAIFVKLSQSADPSIRAAGLVGLGHTGGPDSLTRLLQATVDGDPIVRGAVAEALAAAPGQEATMAICQALSRKSPGQSFPRTLLVRVLGERKDATAVPALVGLLKSGESELVLETIRTLGRIGAGDAEVAAALFASVRHGSDALLEAAEEALARMAGDDVTRTIAELTTDRDPRVRALAVRSLGYRASDEAATRTIVSALRDPDEGVSLAAIESLARLRDPATVIVLLPLLEKDGKVAQAVEKALSRFTSPAATEALVEKAQANDTPAAVRAGILRALTPREDKALRDLFIVAASDGDDRVAIAGLEALARLRDRTTAPTFLSRIEDANVNVKRAAVRGYLTIAEAGERDEPSTALRIYREALGMDIGDEEKRIALRGLGRLADLSSLELVEPLLDSDSLKAVAAEAALPMAFKLRDAGDRERASGLCRKIVEATRDRNVLRDAARCLREMGIDMQLAAKRGCITNWWVLGPFPNRERATKNDFVPVHERIDLSAPVHDEGNTLSWKYVPVDDPLGLLDFEKTVARMDNCGAYAYAEVESEREQDVLLKFGSDDSVFCWLNGERVHAWDGDRGWGEDQDTVSAHLIAGTNTILCKVLNGGAQWSLSLRITDRNGTPLILKQRAP